MLFQDRITPLSSQTDDTITYLQTQIESCHYATPSDYIQALIQANRDRQARLETLAIKGIQSGSSTPITPDDWTHIRATVRHNLSQGN